MIYMTIKRKLKGHFFSRSRSGRTENISSFHANRSSREVDYLTGTKKSVKAQFSRRPSSRQVMAKSQLTLITFCALVVMASSRTESKSCARQGRRSDNCMKNALLIGRENLVLPRSVVDMERLVCASLPGDIKCMTNVRRCLKPFPRTLFNVAMRTVRAAANRHFCGSDAIKANFVSAFGCVRTEEQMKEFYLMFDALTATVDNVATKSATDELIPHMCCGYFYFMQESKRIMESVCKDKSEHMTSIILNVMSTIFEDVMDMGCGKLKTVPICERTFPELQVRLEGIWSSRQANYTVSPLNPLLRVLERLDSAVTHE